MQIITIDLKRDPDPRIPWNKISDTTQIHALYFVPGPLPDLLALANRRYAPHGKQFQLSVKGNHAVIHLQGTQPHFGMLNTWANAKGRPPVDERISRRPIDPNDDTLRDSYGRPIPCNSRFRKPE